MSQLKSKFPQEKPDRRKRSRSRPQSSDRRTSTRYEADFPVTIYARTGGREKTYEGVARDVSDGGIWIELRTGDLPESGLPIRVEFAVPKATMPEEFVHGRMKLDSTVLRADGETKRVGVGFEKPMSKRLAGTVWNYLRIAATLGLLAATLLIVLIKLENIYFFWFDVPVFLYSICVGSYLVSRFFFAGLYRPPEVSPDLPKVTIVIPAYNEEDLIRRTITHAMEAAYPAEKLQCIAVNDGSTDKTLEIMQELRKEYPDLVVIDLEKNKGKRFALATGAKLATGDIIVFIDSDSFLSPDAIRHIVDGFADPKVAAVCGHCEVENQWTNFLTKMQAVRYYIGFRIMKGAESIFDSVTCLSGPLAAYRRVTLMQHLNDWVHQTFLGRPATFGDDRSLTNFLLKKHRVIYDSRALTTTFVPETYGQFFRQQLRWKRSWFRESTRAASFMWRKQPFMSLSYYLGFLLPIVGPAVVLRAMVFVPVFYHVAPLKYIMGIVLMSALMCTVYLFAKKSRLWVYGIFFCFFYMLVLIWQLPWAMLTFWKTTWGTRG